MTISESGLGDDWSVPVGIDYANTENRSFTVLDPTTVIVAGDRGRAAPWEVWAKRVTVEPACERTITGKHSGRLSVGAGGLCLIGAQVTGPVEVKDGGRTFVQDSKVIGPVTASRASVVSVCSSQVTGPVTVLSASGSVAIGDTTAGCDPSVIRGPLRVSNATGPVVLDRSTVFGPVALAGNSSRMATVVSGLTVRGPLSCSGNSQRPTASGVPLAADSAKGQCAS